MASNDIVPTNNRTVTVREHTRSAPTPRSSEVTRVTERATFVETADSRTAAFERITEFGRGKK